ncbi:MAG: hypothetical protein AB7K71_13730 [Polyangiaceae bacterium]
MPRHKLTPRRSHSNVGRFATLFTLSIALCFGCAEKERESAQLGAGGVGGSGGSNSAGASGAGAPSGGNAGVTSGGNAGANGGSASAGGPTGGAPAGGSAGISTGGGAGAAGSAGTATGGSAGNTAGGAAGEASGGSGGTPPTPVYVKCGNVQCPVQDGGKCCYVYDDQNYICQSAAASCTTTGSGPYHPKYPYTCDGTADCPAGQICCYTGSPVVPAGGATCADTCPSSPAAPVFQVCDPAQTAPSDCLNGSCKPSTAGPPGLFFCR